MSCRNFEDLVVLHAYGELDAADVPRLTSHVGACAACAALLASHQAVAGMVSHVAPPPAHQLSNERLREAILQAEIQRPRISPLNWLGIGAPLAAAAAFAVFVFWPSANVAIAPKPTAESAVADSTQPDSRLTTAPSSVGGAVLESSPVVEPDVIQSATPVKRPSSKRTRPSGGRYTGGRVDAGAVRSAFGGGSGTGSPGVPASSAAEEPLIIIAPNPSGSDGTSDATEMRSTDVSSIGG